MNLYLDIFSICLSYSFKGSFNTHKALDRSSSTLHKDPHPLSSSTFLANRLNPSRRHSFVPRWAVTVLWYDNSLLSLSALLLFADWPSQAQSRSQYKLISSSLTVGLGGGGANNNNTFYLYLAWLP